MEEHPLNEKFKLYGTLALSLSLLVLAFSILYIAWEARQWRKELPELLRISGETADKITPAISDISEVGKLVEPILDEVAASRKTIDKTVEELKITREKIPGILKDIEPITRQIEKTALELPTAVRPVLDEVSKTRELVPGILDEVRQTRELVPGILDEVRQTREDLPSIMDRADEIVAGAQGMGKEAGKGAVSGLFSGIISMPFSIVGKVGKGAASIFSPEDQKHLTVEDINLMNETAAKLAEKGKVGETKKWSNKNSSNSGRITLLEKDEGEGRPCRQLKIETFIKGIEPRTALVRGCKLPDGAWEVMEGVLPDAK